MNLRSDQIALLLQELQFLVGGFLENVHQPRPQEVVFEFRIPENRVRAEDVEEIGPFYPRSKKQFLLISIDRNHSRLHLVPRKPGPDPSFSPGPVSGAGMEFKRLLRKHLEGTRLEALCQKPGDRVVALAFSSLREGKRSPAYLMVELMGSAGAMVLLDGESRLLGYISNKKRVADRIDPDFFLAIAEGKWDSPAAEKMAGGSRKFSLENNLRVFEQSGEEIQGARILDRIRSHQGRLRSKIKALSKKLESLQADKDKLNRWKDAERQGEILKIHYALLRKGMEVFAPPKNTRVDQPDGTPERGSIPPPGEMRIPLDPALSPKENMARYFEKAKKYKRGMREIEIRLDRFRGELEKSREALEELRNIQSLDQLDSWESGYSGFAGQPGTPVSKPGKEKSPPSGSREFRSSDGFLIWVGKNDKQNDEITFRIAKGNDLWLHVRNFPGSHVVVRSEKNRQIPRTTLEEAAMLALFFSSRRKDGRGDILYTERKNVRKPKNARPGSVIVAREKNIFIRMEEARLERLLGKSENP